MALEYTITTPKIEDAQNALDYLKQVGGETNFLTFGKEGIGFSLKEEEKFFKKIPDNTIFFVVKNDKDEIVGAANCTQQDHRKNHSYELGISLLQKYTGQGIGSQLMQKLIEEVKRRGGSKIILNVDCENVKALALYKKFGFEIEGRHKNALKLPSGEYRDDYSMGLIL